MGFFNRGVIAGTWGMTLLGVWLILTGVIALAKLSFEGLGLLMAALALASGVLILLRK